MEEILKVDESKIDDVFEIISKCSEWMAKEHKMTHWKEYYTIEVLLEKFEHSNIYIEYLNSKPIGTISVSENPPKYYISNSDGKNGETVDYTTKFPSSRNENTKAAYISALGVIPEQQGSGLASKLLRKAEEEAIRLGCNVIRFDSRMAFTSVINFYEKRGYKKVDTMMDGPDEYGLFEKYLTDL